MKKIYLASSWKNESAVKEMAAYLRGKGFEVDDFTDDSRGRYVFRAADLPGIEKLDARSLLQHEPARRAYEQDKQMLDWADVVVLMLPAGRSAHLEAGYAKGTGKRLLIFHPVFPPGEYDVMYGFADLITDDPQELVACLTANRSKRPIGD